MAWQVREIGDGELEVVFPVVQQQRPDLELDDFVKRVGFQRAHGYHLAVAWLGADPVGVVGMRLACNLARGPHLQLEDLVVDGLHYRSGVGQALLAYAEQFARRSGCLALVAEARPEAENFFAHAGYSRQAALFRRRFDE